MTPNFWIVVYVFALKFHWQNTVKHWWERGKESTVILWFTRRKELSKENEGRMWGMMDSFSVEGKEGIVQRVRVRAWQFGEQLKIQALPPSCILLTLSYHHSETALNWNLTSIYLPFTHPPPPSSSLFLPLPEVPSPLPCWVLRVRQPGGMT